LRIIWFAWSLKFIYHSVFSSWFLFSISGIDRKLIYPYYTNEKWFTQNVSILWGSNEFLDHWNSFLYHILKLISIQYLSALTEIWYILILLMTNYLHSKWVYIEDQMICLITEILLSYCILKLTSIQYFRHWQKKIYPYFTNEKLFTQKVSKHWGSYDLLDHWNSFIILYSQVDYYSVFISIDRKVYIFILLMKNYSHSQWVYIEDRMNSLITEILSQIIFSCWFLFSILGIDRQMIYPYLTNEKLFTQGVSIQWGSNDLLDHRNSSLILHSQVDFYSVFISIDRKIIYPYFTNEKLLTQWVNIHWGSNEFLDHLNSFSYYILKLISIQYFRHW